MIVGCDPGTFKIGDIVDSGEFFDFLGDPLPAGTKGKVITFSTEEKWFEEVIAGGGRGRRPPGPAEFVEIHFD